VTSRGAGQQTDSPPRVRLDILDHVVIYVQDLDRALDFYRDVLGLQVRVAHEDWVEFGTRGAGIALHAGGRRARAPKDYRRGGMLPTIRVQSVESAVAYLNSRGVKVTEIKIEPFGRLAVFADPEGNQLQLLEPHE
jgi:lactoylglutathione lyase